MNTTRHPKSIRSILLAAFLMLSAAIVAIITIMFSMIQYQSGKDEATRDMHLGCNAIANNLNQIISEMDTVLLYSIASPELKAEFSRYLSAETAFEKNSARNDLAGTMISLKGFNFSIRQMNLYDMENGGYGAGDYNGELGVKVSEQPWYENTKELAGKRYINAPEKDPMLSSYAGLDEDTLYFGLNRQFYDEHHHPVGFIEAKEYYQEVFENALLPVKGVNCDIAVYDNTGRQLYPAEEAFPYNNFIGRTEIVNSWKGNTQVLVMAEDEKDGLVVIMAMDNSEFMAPVYQAVAATLFVSIMVFLVIILVAVALAKRLSDPIQTIYSFLSGPRMEYERLDMPDTGILEVDKLRDSLNETIQTQERATSSMMVMKDQEMQAQTLALQSQMNPFFLYSSLATMSEMLDQGKTDQVSAMCRDVMSILHYINSNDEERSSIRDEIAQVKRFYSCLKRHHGKNISIECNVEPSILECRVPKLCVQFLVENAVQSVLSVDPPWKILVKGERQDDNWVITVYDNGPGFDSETAKEMQRDMAGILTTGILPSLQTGDIGILNIFIRLYLLDGVPFIFEFGNREEGGAFVKAGGVIKNDN